MKSGSKGNSSTRAHKMIAGDRMTMFQISGMGSIVKASELSGRKRWKRRKRRIRGKRGEGHMRKRGTRGGTPMHETPRFGAAKTTGDIFKGTTVSFIRMIGEASKEGDSIADVKTTNDTGTHQFTKKLLTRESHAMLEFAMFLSVFEWTSNER